MYKGVFYRNESVSEGQRSAGWVFVSSSSLCVVLMLTLGNLGDTQWKEGTFSWCSTSIREKPSQGEGY